MKDIALVIMAAGIGSRYGAGIKQLQKVGPQGEIIIDYSIHDALEAGSHRRQDRKNLSGRICISGSVGPARRV